MAAKRHKRAPGAFGLIPPSYHAAGLVVISFLVAWAAQWVMAIKAQAFTLILGTLLYAAAVMVFLRAFKGLPGEKTTQQAFPQRMELFFFTLILLLAAGVRLWRLDSIPPGLFADQGNQAYQALRILHEGYRPIFDHQLLQTPALYLYELAAWFWLFGESELSHHIFFIAVLLLALPFFYWFYRQLAGPRLALLALFVLAVLRWHVNLSRWGFEGVHNFLFMAACLAFFLHGLRGGKGWALVLSGFFLGAGMYYYSSFLAVPLLVLVYVGYEWKTNRDRMLELKRPLLAMAAAFFAMLAPLALYVVIRGGVGHRMAQVSLMAEIGKQNSFWPMWENLCNLALMFNRQGDPHLRHNFQSAPMLDGLTAVFFILGLFLALRSWKQRVYFYVLAGLAVCSLPGMLSYPMPSVPRMGEMTPLLALAVAFPIAALLEKIPSAFRRKTTPAAAMIAAVLLAILAWQNLHAYFGRQMIDPVGWYWWDPVPTAIGRRMLSDGGKTDFIVTPRCTDNDSIRFLAYPFRKSYKNFQTTDVMPVFPGRPGMGLEYVLEPQREGARNLVQNLFPDCRRETMADLIGNTICYFYRVDARTLEKVLGLDCTFNPSGNKQHLGDFPRGFPDGPFQADLKGCVFLPGDGEYSLKVEGTSKVSVEIAGRTVVPGARFKAAAGYYGIHVHMDAPPGPSQIEMILVKSDGTSFPLGAGCLTTLPLNRGLLATSRSPGLPNAEEDLRFWEQVIDFDHRCLYPFLSWVQSPTGIPTQWEGKLSAGQEGWYVLKTPEKIPAILSVDDGRYLCQGTATATKIYLSKGMHSLKIELADPPDHFFLSWQKPGQDRFEVVPPEAFGTTGLF